MVKLALFVLATVLAVVTCELCSNTDTTSCAHEVCEAGDQVPTCDSGVCTCADKPQNDGCMTTSDCGDYFRQHHCFDWWKHCIDGKCTCRHV